MSLFASVKLSLGCFLIRPDVPRFNLGPRIVFAFDWTAFKTTQHGDLANVGERVGDGSLKHSFASRTELAPGREIVIVTGEGSVKTRDLFIPG